MMAHFNSQFKLIQLKGRRLYSSQNKSQYDLALEKYKKGVNRRNNRKTFYKVLYYLLGGSFVGFYIYYIGKASGMFQSLKIDNKYREHVKSIQEKHNINQDIIDKKIKDFEEKYQINKHVDEREARLKYGNKELNERVQSLNKEDNLNESEKPTDVKTIDLFNKEGESKDESILLEEFNENGENIVYSKSNEFEQLKILQTSEEINPDPRIMGNTIIFDSRFNEKNNS